MSKRVAVDIGGTFTDMVHVDTTTGEVGVAKGLSTPPDYDRGVVSLLDLLAEEEIESFVHGTTVVINALTERKGAPTALVTTAGMRDILEIQRGNRPDLFNLMFAKPHPFVPRSMRFEVAGRMDFTGKELVPLDETGLLSVVGAAVEQGVRAVAISFLNAYTNPRHEQRAAEVIAEKWPDVEVTTATSLSGIWREFPRTNTAVCDAYVKPGVRGYLGALAAHLETAGVPASERYLMQSAGGIMRFSDGEQAPITLVESGPVGAVIGSTVIADQTGERNVISLDIGGTTAKSALVERDADIGGIPVTDEYYIERSPRDPGHPIQIPCVDIVEIGAGGGSVAWIDAAGSLSVGPQSAGADPGPACYGRGGTQPTLTDANLIAGRIHADHFLGGTMELDVAAACKAMMPLAERLGVDVGDVALGIIRLANSKMVQLLRLVSVRKGRDPRDFTMVASGGNGAIHASALARELHIPRVIIPPHPGHFSAWGMLVSDMRQDVSQTSPRRLDQVSTEDFAAQWSELGERLAGRLADDEDRGTTLIRSADLRYVGQEHTVRVTVPDGPLDDDVRASVRSRFDEAHERMYAFRLESPVEVVTFRLTGVRPVAAPVPASLEGAGDLEAARLGTRLIDFDDQRALETPVFARDRMAAGVGARGPAAIEEDATTTIVFPDQRFTVAPTGALVIDQEESA